MSWRRCRSARATAARDLRARRRRMTLEDFFINRFGERLYRTFFKDYTEKVWGVPCSEISAEWGAQRIKGLSVTKALAHARHESVSLLATDIAKSAPRPA